MIHAYLAGPFFNRSELEFTEALGNAIRQRFGHQLHLYMPHLDSGMILMPDSSDQDRYLVFRHDIDAMDAADLFIIILDNEDSGTCFEMGYAYAKSRQILALWTDVRRKPNLMLAQSAPIASGVDQLLNNIADVLSRLTSSVNTSESQ